MTIHEWRAQLEVDTDHGITSVALYEVGSEGQLSFVDAETFGPFETALDVVTWLTRHWAPRARLRLR